MYTLRRVFEDGSYANTNLGNEYTVVDFLSAKRFKEISEHVYSGSGEGENVGAFVINQSGEAILPVYKDETTYIMTESGKTFDRIIF